MNNKVLNHIRTFGMSGFQITDEIKNIERIYNFDFGHTHNKNINEEEEYYKQFEQDVRIEASNMSQHYELFYCLETSIRKIISETLSDSEGSNWWQSGRIPKDIIQAVADLEKKEVDNGITKRSEFPIDYTTFGQLGVIINSNWDLFATIFKSKRGVEKIMTSLNLLRGPIAHCCEMTEDEVDRLYLTVKDWFRIMA